MIISNNSEPHITEFHQLLDQTLNALQVSAPKNIAKLQQLTAQKFETHLKELMTELAQNTVFENSIELVSGQRFPDIVAKQYYGIEVKTTIKNHWKTTGNSVFEGTRVDGVERIFMFFAKLADPIEFRCRPYEDVLSEVVVTHSPRYLIDMNLAQGQTIFDKINMPYDQLRISSNPILPIKDYYRSKLRDGDELWWMDADQDKANNLILRMWNNLSKDEKQLYQLKAMIYFPELFGKQSDKFGKLAMWLVQQESIVCPNIRDQFTAGGRIEIHINNQSFGELPRIFSHLNNNLHLIQELFKESDPSLLSHYWNEATTEMTKYELWTNKVVYFSQQHHEYSENIVRFLKVIL